MTREKSVVSRVLVFAVFIGLETASLLMLSHNGSLQRLWIARVSHGFMARTWGATQAVGEYFSLKKRNDLLALENHRLGELVHRYESALEASGSTAPTEAVDGYRFIPAKIIKASSNSQHNYLIVDKGSDDGIVQNAGIITSRGVIGIIDAVSRHYSYALSFMNTELSISARLGKEGAVGPLVWDGVSSCGAILKEIPLQVKFSPGDTVYTSGYSAIFPPDIPLGVTGASKIINGATNEIRINLFQNQNSLKYVTIVENTRIGEIEEMEQQQEPLKQ